MTPAPHPSLEQAVRRGGRALGCSVRRLRKGAESALIAALGMGSSAHRDACISEEPALELPAKGGTSAIAGREDVLWKGVAAPLLRKLWAVALIELAMSPTAPRES